MNLRACGLSAFAAVAFFSTSLHAEEAPAHPAPIAIAHPATAYPIQTPASTMPVAIYLVLLIALLGAGFYVMRNGFAFLQPRPKGQRKLDISETRTLGNRQFLIVAEYESRKMLIGVCPGRIEYLCTLTGAEPEFPQLATEEEK